MSSTIFKRGTLLPVTIAVISSLIFHIQNKPYDELLEVDSCPFCFGKSLCNKFYSNEIATKKFVTIFKLLTFITNYFGINNVIFATLNDTDVVVKKLADKWEFKELDDEIAKENIDFLNVKKNIDKMKKYLYIPFGSNVIRSVRMCPTTDNFDLLYKLLDIYESDTAEEASIYMWYTLAINPEPLILKILPQEDGWPVPKYYGSCGRTVVCEYYGDMLTDRVQDPWTVRSSIARQLLEAALNFTFNHPSLSFYLTDVTPDNIAVSSQGRIAFIDLENIIIVDRSTKADSVPTTWNETHFSDDTECSNCFAFSSDDICSHITSDHNIYAVCREILSPHSYLIDGGLLHTPPELFLKRHPYFWTLLLHCVHPTKENNRFYYAKQLLKLLK